MRLANICLAALLVGVIMAAAVWAATGQAGPVSVLGYELGGDMAGIAATGSDTDQPGSLEKNLTRYTADGPAAVPRTLTDAVSNFELVAQAQAATAEPCPPAKEDPWLTTPTEVLIESQGFSNRKRGPVTLSHQDHNLEYGVACEVCHHFRSEEESDLWRCDDCHSASGKIGKVPSLKIAFHSDCKSCHRERQKTGESDIAPFIDCGACHEAKD